MRTIERNIVGAFIFSSDNKVLLGHNKKGGVYQNQLIVPGGGIEEGETELAAVKREVIEETGIDISNATITRIEGTSSGESEKTLRDTGERVVMKMTFHDFKVQLPIASSEVRLAFEDDYAEAQWYTPSELAQAEIGPATEATLRKLTFVV
jgi:8-oxo-dGTP pyrophosphatase MutT (NUDIX family)